MFALGKYLLQYLCSFQLFDSFDKVDQVTMQMYAYSMIITGLRTGDLYYIKCKMRLIFLVYSH